MTDPLVVERMVLRIEEHKAGDDVLVGSNHVMLGILPGKAANTGADTVRIVYLAPPG